MVFDEQRGQIAAIARPDLQNRSGCLMSIISCSSWSARSGHAERPDCVDCPAAVARPKPPVGQIPSGSLAWVVFSRGYLLSRWTTNRHRCGSAGSPPILAHLVNLPPQQRTPLEAPRHHPHLHAGVQPAHVVPAREHRHSGDRPPCRPSLRARTLVWRRLRPGTCPSAAGLICRAVRTCRVRSGRVVRLHVMACLCAKYERDLRSAPRRSIACFAHGVNMRARAGAHDYAMGDVDNSCINRVGAQAGRFGCGQACV